MEHNTTFTRRQFIGLAALAISVLSGCGDMKEFEQASADDTKVDARIAVVFDRSGSFAQYAEPAANIVKTFVLENNLSGTTDIMVVPMGARPGEIRRFSADEFIDKEGIAALKGLSKTYAEIGTDVVGAVERAVARLRERKDKEANRLFVLVFSDCIVDQAKDGLTPVFKELDQFDWSSLRGIGLRFFYVSPSSHDRLLTLTQSSDLDVLFYEPGEIRSGTVLRSTGGTR